MRISSIAPGCGGQPLVKIFVSYYLVNRLAAKQFTLYSFQSPRCRCHIRVSICRVNRHERISGAIMARTVAHISPRVQNVPTMNSDQDGTAGVSGEPTGTDSHAAPPDPDVLDDLSGGRLNTRVLKGPRSKRNPRGKVCNFHRNDSRSKTVFDLSETYCCFYTT
jgi:hypothetical protein